jgi:hypothetical protein
MKNNELKTFRKCIKETIKDLNYMSTDADNELANSFKTLRHEERMKPSLFPIKKSSSLIKIHKYLTLVVEEGDCIDEVEASLFKTGKISEVDDHWKQDLEHLYLEQKFMLDFINSRYSFCTDGINGVLIK